MGVKTHLLHPRWLFQHNIYGTPLGGAGPVADPDRGYNLESGSTDWYVLESGSPDSYLLEGDFLETEDTLAAPDEVILQRETNPFLEV